MLFGGECVSPVLWHSSMVQLYWWRNDMFAGAHDEINPGLLLEGEACRIRVGSENHIS